MVPPFILKSRLTLKVVGRDDRLLGARKIFNMGKVKFLFNNNWRFISGNPLIVMASNSIFLLTSTNLKSLII